MTTEPLWPAPLGHAAVPKAMMSVGLSTRLTICGRTRAFSKVLEEFSDRSMRSCKHQISIPHPAQWQIARGPGMDEIPGWDKHVATNSGGTADHSRFFGFEC